MEILLLKLVLNLNRNVSKIMNILSALQHTCHSENYGMNLSRTFKYKVKVYALIRMIQ